MHNLSAPSFDGTYMEQIDVIGKPPHLWSKQEVRQWVTWCRDEYSLSLTTQQVYEFAMNGKALLVLTKEDFCDRAPSSGDVLYNTLSRLTRHYSAGLVAKRDSGYPSPPWSPPKQVNYRHHTTASSPLVSDVLPSIPQSSPPCPDTTDWTSHQEKPPALLEIPQTERPLSPIHAPTILWHLQQGKHPIIHEVAPLVRSERQDSSIENATCDDVKPKPYDSISPGKIDPELTESKKVPLKKRPLPNDKTVARKRTKEDDIKKAPRRTKKLASNGNNKLLWEFIAELLQTVDRILPVRWLEITSLTFRITDPNLLASMWGQQKEKNNMTYEKLSRALRYYYRMNIISKVPTKKLTYRFTTPPEKIIKGIRGAKPGVPHKRRKKPAKDEEATDAGEQSRVPSSAEGCILDLSLRRSKKSVKSRKRRPVKPKKTLTDAENNETDILHDDSPRMNEEPIQMDIKPTMDTPSDLESARYDHHPDLDCHLTIGSDAGHYDASVPERYDPSGCLDLSTTARHPERSDQPLDIYQLAESLSPNKLNGRKLFQSEHSAFSVVKRSSISPTTGVLATNTAISPQSDAVTLPVDDEYVAYVLRRC